MIQQSNLKILIVEDEALIAEDIKDICELAGYLVLAICYNGRQAINSISNTSFDLALLDINLESELSGFDVADFIRLQNINLPYIFLTSYSDQSTLNTAREYHPVGYITKPFRKEQLISTIEISLKKTMNNLKFSSVNSNNSNEVTPLSERETEIALLVCAGLTNEEIATRLFLSVNTIKFHIKNLYDKLGIKNRIQLMNVMSK